jgi:hypothetical protein
MIEHEIPHPEQDPSFLHKIGSFVKSLVHHEPYSLEAVDARILEVAQTHGAAAFSTAGDISAKNNPLAEVRRLAALGPVSRAKAQANFVPKFMPSRHQK